MKSILFKFVLFIPVLVFAMDVAQNTSPPSVPASTPPQQVQPPQPAEAPSAPPVAPPPVTAPPRATLPADFELISIKPYFKNKPRLGKLTATLVNAVTNENLGNVSGDFGDCKSCIRGASIKGKIGIRVYGQDIQKLSFSRKQSSSIKVTSCPQGGESSQFNCEFTAEGVAMRLSLKVEP